MRKHGLFGVVIATLLGVVGLLQLLGGNTPHATSTPKASGTQLAAEISAGRNENGVAAVLPSGYVRVITTPAWLHLNLSTLAQMARTQEAEAQAAARAIAARAAAARAVAVAQAAAAARAHAAAAAAAAAEQAAAQARAKAQAATPTPPPRPPVSSGYVPLGGVWAELRNCESGGNYAEDTGNGYYGAYQFAPSTWWSLGFSGLPSSASPATQDRAAAELQARSGWGQWPACSAALGL
jgi:hypothetical protein